MAMMMIMMMMMMMVVVMRHVNQVAPLQSLCNTVLVYIKVSLKPQTQNPKPKTQNPKP